MRIVRILSLVALVGIWAVAARADVSDPAVFLHETGADCPVAYCVDLTYSGPTEFVIGYLFPTVPSTGIPDAEIFPTPDFTCGTDDSYTIQTIFGPVVIADLFTPVYTDRTAPPPPIDGTFLG